jgi:hypothetical protein
METAMTIHFSEMLSGWAIRRLIASIAIPLLSGAFLLSSCGPAMTRPPRERADLEKLRTTDDELSAQENRKILGQLLERTKAEYDKAGGEERHRWSTS